jgi:acetylornithine deacetylase/succinyl-diaminopimelate desuccinylase-like protein
MAIGTWLDYFETRTDENVAELLEFLRIPSISALPDFAEDVLRASQWVVKRMEKAGVPDIEVIETGGHPLVIGRWQVDDQLPTVMLYAHYDVQPPDPLDQWVSPPFEPEIRDGRIYARGSGDDKAGLLITLLTVEALVAQNGQPPVNLLFLFEGEEEIGSPNVSPAVHQHRDRLACDIVVSADGMQWGAEIPSLLVSLKGIAGCQINLRTASTDGHSGIYGAGVRNAAQSAAELAASLHDTDGRVAVPGFYERVIDPTPEERQETAEVPFDESTYFAPLGVSKTHGETGFTPLERMWMRPTLDINGIWSGFQGTGSKTVTPAESHLKITCRLVRNQNPDELLDLIEAHARNFFPDGVEVEFERFGTATAYVVPRDMQALLLAGESLEAGYGRPPVIVRSGGSIPVAQVFKEALDADFVDLGFSLEDCNAHAPNEWFRVKDLVRGAAITADYLERLGATASA